MHDYEAHLSSYDHSHKQRLKDMKAMVRDPGAAARARRQEMKAQEGVAGVVSIKLGEAAASSAGAAGPGAGAGGGFKKGGFKKTGFTASGFVSVGGSSAAGGESVTSEKRKEEEQEEDLRIRAMPGSELVESDTEDEGYEVYDPRKPTD